MSVPDVTRLAQHLGLSIEEFRTRYTLNIAVEGQDEPGVCLAKAPHGCIFLDDATNACTVQEAKPTQCRMFPFWPMALESPEAWRNGVVELCGPTAFDQGRHYSADEIRTIASQIAGVARLAPDAANPINPPPATR